MLLNFTIENWMSFQFPVRFSMIATVGRRFSERLVPLKKYNCRVLPVSTLYGGNASGKSNFVEAFSFVKKLLQILFLWMKISQYIPSNYLKLY